MTERKINKDIETLKNADVAIAYLQKALEKFAEDGDAKTFLAALRKLTKAQGGMTSLSRRTSINRQNLYRTFASTGNPKFKSLGSILKGLGYQLAIQPIKPDEQIKKEIDITIEKIIANTAKEEVA